MWSVNAAGEVTVTASATNYTSASITIDIIARNADDVEGFRVTIASQADGAWVGFGNKKVKVQVTRLNAQSFSWTSFQSLAVSLRDTVPVAGSWLQAMHRGQYCTTCDSECSFANQDGNIVFSTAAKVRYNLTDGGNRARLGC